MVTFTDELSLDDLNADIKTIENKLLPLLAAHPTATRVLVLGTTGSCKSTLVNAMAGKRLRVTKDEYDKLLVTAPDGLAGSEIGHTLLSQTSTPSCWYDGRTNVVYWDCPGFMDTRGASQEVVNAFAMNCLLQKPCKVNVLLAIQEDAFGVERGMSALKVFAGLADLLPVAAQLQQCVTLVITNSRKGCDPSKMLGRLRDDLLAQHDLVEFENSSTVRQIIDGLRAFTFPAPYEQGVYGEGLNPVFADQAEIATRLASKTITDPFTGFPLSAEARSVVYRMMRTSGNVVEVLMELIKLAQGQYRQPDVTLMDCQQWIQVAHNLSNGRAGKLTELADTLRNQLPHTAKVEAFSLLARIQTTARYAEFACRVMGYPEPDINEFLIPAMVSMETELRMQITQKQAVQRAEDERKKLARDLEASKSSNKKEQAESAQRLAEMEAQRAEATRLYNQEMEQLRERSIQLERDMQSQLSRQRNEQANSTEDLRRRIRELEEELQQYRLQHQRRHQYHQPQVIFHPQLGWIQIG